MTPFTIAASFAMGVKIIYLTVLYQQIHSPVIITMMLLSHASLTEIVSATFVSFWAKSEKPG